MRAFALVCIGVVVCIFAIFHGRYDLPFEEFICIFNCADNKLGLDIVLNIRAPRVFAAFLVGCNLAVSGTVFQAIFKNPLVGPNILGVASGAGFGAALAIMLFDNLYFVEIFAFTFGLFAVFMAYFISSFSSRVNVLTLVLSGIVISAIFSALISLIKYSVDTEEKLPTIIYWLMGSLSGVTWGDLLYLFVLSTVCLSVLFLLRWKINILCLGDEQARFLGENVFFLRIVVIVCATLITSACVGLCGIVGWVGLLIPHLSRMIVGANHAVLVPFSAFLGGVYLVIVDTIARSATSAEIPLSILTALIGAPLIAYLLIKKGKEWF